jgi:PAS domain S-box-containing protein
VYDYDLPSGQIIWSGNIQKALGYTSEEMGDINRWGDLIHPEDQGEAFRLLEEAQKNLSKYDVTYRFKTNHNGYVWIKDTGFFISNSAGEANRMVGEMADITMQVQFEKEIRHLASFPLHNPEIVIEIKKDGSLNYANPSFFEAMRRLGLTDHKPFVATAIREMIDTNSPWKLSVDVVIAGRTFNEKIYYLVEKELVRIYAYDLTERLAAEKQISDLELTYKTLFDSATDAILIIDIEGEVGRIASANKAAATLYGYSMTEFLNRNLIELDVETPNSISFNERLHQLLEAGRQNFEVCHRRKDGTVIPLEVVASIIEVSGRKFLLAIERDISSRKKADEEIQLQYKFIESLASASPDIVYVYDIDQNQYVYANQHMANAYGFPLDQLKVQGHDLMRQVLDPADAVKIPGWIERLMAAKDGEIIESQFRLKTSNGQWRTFRSRESVFLRDALGVVKQFIGTSNDITERLAAEEALRESEIRFRALHEASFGGIAIHDMGVIVECNQGLTDIGGYSYDELIGMNGLKMIMPEDHPLVLQKIISNDQTPYDVRGVRKDGTTFSLEIRGKAAPYKGKILRITEFRDITERKKVAEKIIEQNARLQAIAEDLKFKNEQLDEFTQIVSHNLRSPAGNIVSLVEFLNSPQSPTEQQEIFALLRESGEIILNTLSELNEVLKIKQNKNIDKQQLEFETVFLKVRNMLNAHILNIGAMVDSDFSQAPTILYPNIYLESIMLNLLSNALKYSHPDRMPHIKFTTRMVDDQLTLAVTDNGLGINLDRYRHQIFKMRKTFHQHPDSRGIGLFMIKNQIEAMSGQIGVMSKENEGSTFIVTF